MAGRSEVYSWRLSPALKASLEEAARRERRAVSRLLEDIVTSHLAEGGDASDAETQRKLRTKAESFAGCIWGKDPRRAARARLLVRARLRRPGGAR